MLEQGSWLAEYYVGAKKTFYSVEFSPNFAGMLFDDAVVHIFELFEVMLRRTLLDRALSVRSGPFSWVGTVGSLPHLMLSTYVCFTVTT